MNLATTSNYMQPPNEVPCLLFFSSLSFFFLGFLFSSPFAGDMPASQNLRRVPWKVNIGKLIIGRELTQIFHNFTQQQCRSSSSSQIYREQLPLWGTKVSQSTYHNLFLFHSQQTNSGFDVHTPAQLMTH